MIWHPLLWGWRFEWIFFLLHLHQKQWIGMDVENSSVTCIPRQHHYSHCLCNYSSRGGASLFHGLTTRWTSVLSWLQRHMWRSIFSFLPKGGYVIVLVEQYLWINNALGVNFCLDIFLFIRFIFYKFYDAFLWSVLKYGIHFLFDIIFCLLEHSYFYYVYIFIVFYLILYCLFNILLQSSEYFYSCVLQYTIYFFINFDQ